MSVARVYANVNTVRPKEYWDYESLAITWGYGRRASGPEGAGGLVGPGVGGGVWWARLWGLVWGWVVVGPPPTGQG
jgi:hypothetical protein